MQNVKHLLSHYFYYLPHKATLMHFFIFIRVWKNQIKTGINLSNITFNNILFAYDLCLFKDNDDELQRSIIYPLNKTGKDYYLRISKSKTKVIVFKDNDPTMTKNILENKSWTLFF